MSADNWRFDSSDGCNNRKVGFSGHKVGWVLRPSTQKSKITLRSCVDASLNPVMVTTATIPENPRKIDGTRDWWLSESRHLLQLDIYCYQRALFTRALRYDYELRSERWLAPNLSCFQSATNLYDTWYVNHWRNRWGFCAKDFESSFKLSPFDTWLRGSRLQFLRNVFTPKGKLNFKPTLRRINEAKAFKQLRQTKDNLTKSRAYQAFAWSILNPIVVQDIKSNVLPAIPLVKKVISLLTGP